MIGLQNNTKNEAIMGSGISNLYNGTKGSYNSLPKNKSQLDHIFAVRPGHLKNTKKNKKKLEELINDNSAYKGTDKSGCKWYIKIAKNGAQYWAKVHNEILSDGDYNKSPKKWNNDTGLFKSKPNNYNPTKKKNGGSK